MASVEPKQKTVLSASGDAIALPRPQPGASQTIQLGENWTGNRCRFATISLEQS